MHRQMSEIVPIEQIIILMELVNVTKTYFVDLTQCRFEIITTFRALERTIIAKATKSNILKLHSHC